MPTLGCVEPALTTDDLGTSETQLESDIVDCRVARRDVTGDQTRILLPRGKQITRSEISGADALVPGQPTRSHQRIRTGQQHRFADGCGVRTVGSCHHHGPLPAAIAGQIRDEAMGRGRIVLGGDTEILADAALHRIDQCAARQVCCLG